MKLYPLRDFCKEAYQYNQAFLRARATGEFRAPKKGEWYLSGAIIEGYLAKGNFIGDYHIAEIVLIEKRNVETVVEIVKESIK